MSPPDRLSEHFTLDELIASETALRRGLDNSPTLDVVANLRRLCATLETVRAVLGAPIHITSGYRSPAVNLAIGGARTSAHVNGCAADFKCPQFGSPLDCCREIVQAGIQFDQLIDEGEWVHIGIPPDGKSWRREILTAHFGPSGVRYSTGLR